MNISFTDRELDVMAVVWELGSATVRDVQDRLEDPLAYTTVLTILRTLEAKGYLRHEAEGRAHRYHPAVRRDQASSSALRRLVSKLFAGRPEALLTQLVSDQKLTADQLARIRRLLDERLRDDAEEGG